MKKIVFVLCTLTLLISCKSSKDSSTTTNPSVQETTENPATPKKVTNYPVK